MARGTKERLLIKRLLIFPLCRRAYGMCEQSKLAKCGPGAICKSQACTGMLWLKSEPSLQCHRAKWPDQSLQWMFVVRCPTMDDFDAITLVLCSLSHFNDGKVEWFLVFFKNVVILVKATTSEYVLTYLYQFIASMWNSFHPAKQKWFFF